MDRRLLVVVVAVGVGWVAWSATRAQAPLHDGAYLTYDFDGTRIEVTFASAEGDRLPGRWNEGHRGHGGHRVLPDGQ